MAAWALTWLFAPRRKRQNIPPKSWRALALNDALFAADGICQKMTAVCALGVQSGRGEARAMNKLFVSFYFSYSRVVISLWPSNQRSEIYPKGKRREWIRHCCKYLYERGRANHSFFQGGHAYEIPL